jgi:hypothetical protein
MRIQSARSLVEIKNRIVPNTLPCGTLLMAGASSEKPPLTTTFWISSDRNDLTHLLVLPRTPYC